MTRVNEMIANSFKVRADNVGSPTLTTRQTQVDKSQRQVEMSSASRQRPAGSRNGPAPNQQPDMEQIQHLIEELNHKLRQDGHPTRRVSLALRGENQDRYVVEVREQDSERVIMQFPPQSMLDFSARMQDIVGMVVDQKS